MIVKTEIVIYYRVICMVSFEQVLEGARPLVRCCLDVMYLYRWQIHFQLTATYEAEK